MGIRNELTVEVAKEHMTGDQARCVGRVFLAAPGAAVMLLAIGNDEPTSEQRLRIRAIAAASVMACRDAPDSGLA